MNAPFHIFPSEHQLLLSLCHDFATVVQKKAENKENLFVALSGGNTPKKFFQKLSEWNLLNASHRINWSLVHFFWADERCVPPFHAESNYGMTQKHLLNKLNIKPEQIHRIQGENNPDAEVTRYTDEIMKQVPMKNDLPLFDWIFLGIGEDGHTASIFPNRHDLLTTRNICAVVQHPVTGQQRITLTGKTINNACRITFLITGKTKSSIIKEISNHSTTAEKYPAYYIKPTQGILDWFIDREAARYVPDP